MIFFFSLVVPAGIGLWPTTCQSHHLTSIGKCPYITKPLHFLGIPHLESYASFVYLKGEQVTITLIYENLSSSFYYESCRNWLERERERERERDTQRDRDRETETERQRRLLGITPRWDTSPESLASSCFFHRRLPHYGLAPRRCDLPTTLSNWPLGLKTCVIIYLPDAQTFLPIQITWHLCCPLFTLRHSCTSCFWNPLYPVCQRLVCNTSWLLFVMSILIGCPILLAAYWA